MKIIDQWRADNKDFQLIDVREPSEHNAENIGGILIPLGDIMSNKDKIKHGKPVVIYCKRGIRSQIAIQRLHRKLPGVLFYNLEGGISEL
ncbi:MAG: adenylyltransferase/sulfurtransferase [Saprospiraceae bacterium]|jgi:adenylyltransferase/sulfurtransferase|tara:strand:+ start:3226 stop:3495 length:270 start_codon:yes stop_codon:yes gene_type:complete